MKNLKKIVILSILLAILTVFFIMRFTVPSVQKAMDLKKELAQAKTDVSTVKTSIENLKQNKLLKKKLTQLNNELEDFDIEFPTEYGSEVLLIDLETFTHESMNRIFALQLFTEKETNYATPEEEQSKTNTRQTVAQKAKTNKSASPAPPVLIMEKPIEIKTVAYYNQIIDFIKYLENYQRKINIESISTAVFDQDKARPNPRVELKINGNIYRSAINPISHSTATSTTGTSSTVREIVTVAPKTKKRKK